MTAASPVLTWTAADGTVTVLDGSAGIWWRKGPIGLQAPDPTNTIDDYTSFDGGVLVNRRRSVRALILPIYLIHATRVQTVMSKLAAMLQGPGTLQYADGTDTRMLKQVIYEAGIDGSGIANKLQRMLAVSMIALDPWWYGPANSQALSTGAVTAFDAAISFDAAIPFDGGVGAGVTVLGDAEAYPVITVIGPATTLTVSANGLSWSIAVALLSTDTLVVDHRPGSRGPRLNGGAVDWSLLTEASRLWTLPAGSTSVVSGIVGGTGATSIIMAWEPRYLTP